MLERIVEIIVLLNLVLSLIIVVWDIYFYFKIPEDERWTKVLYAIVGGLWFIRYMLYILGVEYFRFPNPILLILVTLTLLSLAVASVVRVHKIISVKDMKDDITAYLLRSTEWILKK